MQEPSPSVPSGNPVLRYLAILSAARDFGVSRSDIEDVVRRYDPWQAPPWELAGALVELLPEPRTRV